MEQKRFFVTRVAGFIFVGFLFIIGFSRATYCQNETNINQVKLKNGTIRISLPQHWKIIENKQVDLSNNVIFIRENPKQMLLIEIIKVGNNPLYNLKSYKMKWVEALKEELKGFENSEVYDNVEFFGEPALKISYDTKDKLKRVSIQFLKDRKHHIIDFLCFGCPKEYFDKQWSDVQKYIRGIEFVR